MLGDRSSVHMAIAFVEANLANLGNTGGENHQHPEGLR
jgi:hypothetical protein